MKKILADGYLQGFLYVYYAIGPPLIAISSET